MSLDRDQLIRIALTPELNVAPPPELADQISRAVRETPQRRPLIPTVTLRPRQAAPMLRMVVLMLLLLALLGLSLVVLTQPPARLVDVPMYHGGPERTGVLPGPGPAGEPVIAWQAAVDGRVTFSIRPVGADGRVFGADETGSLSALDEATGATLWRVDVGSRVRASPLLISDLIVVGSDAGDVVALRQVDGSETWRFASPAPVSASLVSLGEMVYVCDEDGGIHALHAGSGEVRWSHDVGGRVNRGPAISNGILYVAAHDGRFSAVEAASGEALWSVELGPGEVSTPIVSGGRAYVGRSLDRDPSLVALDVTGGHELWEFRSPLNLQVRPGALGPEHLYAVAEDHNVYALDAATGGLRWTHTTGGRVGSLASLVGEVLYVASQDGTVRALDTATGSLQWLVELDGEPTIPVVINGRVIVGTTAGSVVAIAGSEDPLE
jgi:eukaryotic-like serine/threonine-protein kinase